MFRLFYKAIFRLLSIKVFLYNIHILYFPSYYNNHVNEISYFPRLQFVYKNLYGSQPEDGFIKKPKHVAVMIFNYLLIVFA